MIQLDAPVNQAIILHPKSGIRIKFQNKRSPFSRTRAFGPDFAVHLHHVTGAMMEPECTVLWLGRQEFAEIESSNMDISYKSFPH
jgi:hypothetical protein